MALWLQTQNKKLLNLDRIESIELRNFESGSSVVARSNELTYTLTPGNVSAADAQYLYAEIAQMLTIEDVLWNIEGMETIKP